jgi:hypothetical protein
MSRKILIKKIVLASFIIILNISLIFYFLIFENNNSFPKKMPKIRITTSEGRAYNLNNDNVTLICLIKTYDEDIIQSLSTSIDFFVENINDTLNIVIFSSSPEMFKESALSSSMIITAYYDEFTVIRPRRDSHFFLYDKNGFLLIDGQLSNKPEEIIWEISNLIGITLQNWMVEEIVDINENISSNPHLKFLQKYLENSLYQMNVFVFFDDVCSS